MVKDLGMVGPFRLRKSVIDAEVESGKVGNFALGREEGHEFHVGYVGRADEDLRSKLKEHMEMDEDLTHFKFTYADSPKKAFHKQAEEYHEFGGGKKLKNPGHPKPPSGMKLRCPVEGCDALK